MNQRPEPAPAVLSVVEIVASPHLHLVRDHPADETLCGRDARISNVVRRTEAACCPVCLADALAAGHVVALTATNSFVNLRRLASADARGRPVTAVPAVVQYDVMTLLGTSVMGEPVVVELRYAADDPVVVTLTLHSAVHDSPQGSWTFERRLLDIGCDEPVDAGHVRVSPVWHPQRGTAVLLDLAGSTAGSGSVAVRADLPVVRRFVDRIHQAVPAGCEWQRWELETRPAVALAG